MNPSNDLAIVYAGWPAQDVRWLPRSGQGGTGRAIFNEPGTTILGPDVVALDASLQYPTATFPGVRRGDRFVIDGHTWIARENAQPTQDGLEASIPLERAQ